MYIYTYIYILLACNYWCIIDVYVIMLHIIYHLDASNMKEVACQHISFQFISQHLVWFPATAPPWQMGVIPNQSDWGDWCFCHWIFWGSFRHPYFRTALPANPQTHGRLLRVVAAKAPEILSAPWWQGDQTSCHIESQPTGKGMSKGDVSPEH